MFIVTYTSPFWKNILDSKKVVDILYAILLLMIFDPKLDKKYKQKNQTSMKRKRGHSFFIVSYP